MAAASVVLWAVPAAAKTTVSVSGDDTVTLHVPIDCLGCSSALAHKWEKEINDAWGKAFKKFTYCDNYHLKLDLTIYPKSESFNGTTGHHRIIVSASNGGTFGDGFQTDQPEHNPLGPDGQTTKDGTRYYESDGDATISEDATPTVVTHEIGHILGLGQDADASGNALPGRGGTLMVGGNGGNTANTELSIDQPLIDRIGHVAQKVNHDIHCDRWHGMYHDQGVEPRCYAGPAPVSHEGTFEATVHGDTVTAYGTLGVGLHCGPAAPPPPVATPYLLRKTRNGFVLQGGPYGTGDIVLTRSGDQATGTATGQSGDVTFTITIVMTCENCRQAVG